MTQDEYDILSHATPEDHSVSVSELADKTDRTLLYGYDFERNTVHVYLKDGLIHWLSCGVHRSAETWEEGTHLVPLKRVYPSLSDFAFASLLKSKDIGVSYTTFSRALEPGVVFAGAIA